MLFSKAIENWNIDLEAGGYSDNTRDLYTRTMNKFLFRIGDKDIKKITPRDISEVWIWLRKEYIPKRRGKKEGPLSGRSLDNIWIAQRNFFGWALKAKLTTSRPDERIPRPEYTSKVVAEVSMPEIEAAIAACEYRSPTVKERKKRENRRTTAARDRALILLLLDSGLRVSEASRLNIGDVDVKTGTIQVAPNGSGRKTKARTTFIGPIAQKALWRYLAERPEATNESALFVTIKSRSRKTGKSSVKRMDRNSIRHALVDIGQRAGLGENLHPHRLRHSAACQMARKGMDAFSLRDIMGWSDMTMPLYYVHLVNADTKAAHARAVPSSDLDIDF